VPSPEALLGLSGFCLVRQPHAIFGEAAIFVPVGHAPSSILRYWMLGIESSEATFLLRELVLRLLQIHMNPVAGVFLTLGQLGQSSDNFERSLYMPLQCPTYNAICFSFRAMPHALYPNST
jgi:hypothetical protein